MKKTDRTESCFRKREEAMLSAGHLIWIAVSAALVAAVFAAAYDHHAL